jgi:hypothetical protein
MLQIDPGTPVFSINNTDHQDIAEINQPNQTGIVQRNLMKKQHKSDLIQNSYHFGCWFLLSPFYARNNKI